MKRTPSLSRLVFPLVPAVLSLLLSVSAARGQAAGREEEIPLYDGRVVKLFVVGKTEKGLDIRTDKGTYRLRWDQVDRSYPDHPLHGRTMEYEKPDPPPVPAGTGTGPAPAAPGASSPRRGAGIDPFLIFLLVLFAVGWGNLWAVKLVGSRDIATGERHQYLNLITLFAGLPLAVFLIIRTHGFRSLFHFGALLRRDKSTPPCRFYTWDNQPLKARSNRSLASGLGIAEIMMARAVKANASDVHFDTTSEGVRVAFRVDGVLRDPENLEPEIGRRAMSAIKMAAGLDVAKRHEAQDGACHLESAGVWYDLRVARAWAVEGETLVVRLLRAGGIGSDLADLGMLKGMVRVCHELTTESSGIIILAGPTGSGKTTTIYALLRKIQGTGRNILTIEDPVEYRLENATQISLNTKVGASFASALKASMRHDPDVILVGEIRDSETMQTAFQAALTGHLVFTTLHATSVLAAIGRLQELGLSAYMINTGLKAVLCQRLIRSLCPACREAYLPSEDELRFWGITPRNEAGKNVFYRPVGCPLCDGSGFHGRQGVFRLLAMDNNVRTVMRPDVPTGDLQEAVEAAATGTIPEFAEKLLWSGETSPEELRKTLDMFDFGKRLIHSHAN